MSLVSVMMPFDLYAVDDMATADLGEIDRRYRVHKQSFLSAVYAI
jgi:hypothetical protein